MNKSLLKITLSVLALGLLFSGPSASLAVESHDELRKLIDGKTSELRILDAQRKALETNLSNVTRETKSLTSELTSIDGTVRQLELSISTNKIAAEKLKYEIESISYDITDIEKDLGIHREALAKLITELHTREQEGFFITFMKKRTLSDNLLEYEAITALNGSLMATLGELRSRQTLLESKLSENRAKRTQREQEQINLANRQSIVSDQREEKKRLLEQTKNQQKLYETRIEELEKKQTEISRIIQQYEDQIRKSFNPSLLPTKRVGVFAHPVEVPVITQTFGTTKFAERAYKTKSHNGLDFGAPVGTPVYAAEDGVVRASQNNDRGTTRWQKYQYGKYILINHENNLATLYAHLSGQVVREGQSVKRGELIGYAGNTGYATGPHLHFGVYWAPSLELKSVPPANDYVPVGVTVDPADYL